jgi:hypothetical protein
MTTRSTFGRLAAVLVVFAQTTFGPHARADEDDVTALLLRGFELRRQHRNEEALAAYEQAFALSPTPAVRAQRALAEQTLGHWVVAEGDLDLALASDDPWVARNRAALEDARAVVQRHLAWVTVDVDVANADIRLDGEALPQGTAARVVAGVGILEVRAPGRIPDIRRVSVAPSEHVHQQIGLTPLVPPPLPPPVAASPASTTSTPPELQAPSPPALVLVTAPKNRSAVPVVPIAVGTLFVAGVAGIVTGAYYGIRSGQDKNAERAQCPTPGSCTQDGLNDYWDAQRNATASDVGFAAGITLLAGGAALWFFERTAPRTKKTGPYLAPAVGMGMGGLVLHGSL